jgi:hypothetical protein
MSIFFLMCLVAPAHRYLQAFAPSNVIVSKLRRERPTTWIASGLMGLSAAFALGAIIAADWAAEGGPGWIHLVVLLWTWNAMKFLWTAAMCPVWILAERRVGGSEHSRI